MKVLGIVCSPRKRGNTEVLVREALAGAKGLGAEVELVTVADKNISPCDGCESCITTGKCKIKDDMQEIYVKLLEADGIIFGSPVYFWSVSAQAKAVIDRTFVFRKTRALSHMVGGAIVVARRIGSSQAFSTILNFFTLQRMVSAAGAIGYAKDEEIGATDRGGGAIAYADKRGDVKADSRAMAEAANLGRAVVRSIKFLQKNKES